ncbi:MAG: hypothetical protein QCH31_00765 [Methanolobus sp.]|nr:hypothetical protein [Methanolobus sp.]
MKDERIEWDIDVSILTNRFILKELLKVLGIAAFIAAGIMILIILPSILSGNFYSNSSNIGDMKYALMLIGMLFFFTTLFIFAYYGNRYLLSYNMDEKGIKTISREDQRLKNSKLNFLIVLTGLLARNPAATGAGFLAASRQDQDMKWKKITKAVFYPKYSTITLHAGYLEKNIVFCTKENYNQISAFIRPMCADSCQIRDK